MPRFSRHRKRRRFGRRRRLQRRFRRTRHARRRRLSRKQRNGTLVHRFRLALTTLTLATGAGGTFGPALFAVALQDCTNFQSYRDLYEEYSIRRVVIKNIPLQTVGVVPTVTHPRGMFYWTRNRFGEPPPSFSTLKADNTVRRIPGFRTVSISYVPNILNEVFETTLLTDYAIKYRPWLRTVNAAVPHYGITTAYELGPINSNVYEQYVYVYIAFRHVLPGAP